MAIPSRFLRTILTTDAAFRVAGFTALKQTGIQQLGYGKNCKLQLQLSSPIHRRPGEPPGEGGISNSIVYSVAVSPSSFSSNGIGAQSGVDDLAPQFR